MRTIARSVIRRGTLNDGAFNCIYETPCGWCSKWDKQCDRKIKNAGVISADKLAYVHPEKPIPIDWKAAFDEYGIKYKE